MTLEHSAKLLRGRWSPPKGRVNVDLIAMVRHIQEGQLEPLTPREMREAVCCAGFAVPDGEAWRIWLYRTKRAGLLS
jgi:hypothetical protein